MSDNISGLISRGEVSEDSTKLIYLRERRAGDAGKLSFTKVEALLKPVAMLITMTRETFADEPAIKAYIHGRGAELFARSFDGVIVEAIEREDVRRFRPRIWETNRRAIRRACRQVKRAGGLDVAAVRVDRNKTVVGAFEQGVTLWTQGEVSSEISDEHDSLHDSLSIRDLVAVRFQQPAVVTVYRPQSFGIVQTRDWRRMRRLREVFG